MVSYREKLLFNLLDESIDEKIAIYSKNGNVTYGNLRKSVLNTTQKIGEKYGFENEVIAVRMSNIENAFKLILSLIFANKTILPLPLEVPEEKADSIIKDIQPIAIFTDYQNSLENSMDFSKFTENIHEYNFKEAIYDDDSDFIIITTSGTTGVPKGCCLKDKAFLGRIFDLYKSFGFKSCDNFLFSSNYSFDVSYTQILTWLFGQGSITIQRKEEDYRVIVDYINEYSVTHLALSPAVAKKIFKNISNNAKTLKEVFVAGERFPLELASEYMRNRPSFKLWNMYGPTEFSIYATFFNIDEYNEEQSVPIGYPLKGVKVKILDESNNIILNDSREGQIALGGEGIFSRYINDEEKTDKVIAKIDEEPYYLTGDLGSISKGKIYYHGRKDQQLKINGIRVESEEIENKLIKYLNNLESVVVSLIQFQGKNQLVAFIVYKNKTTKYSNETMRRTLEKYLEKYFVPKFFIILEEIPLNKNGKVDFVKLTSIYKSKRQKELARDTQGNNESTEHILKKIWEDVLNIKVKNTDNNFFDLGADSLDTITLLSNIEELFNVKLNVEDIYRNPLFYTQEKLISQLLSNNVIDEINKKIQSIEKGAFIFKEVIDNNLKTILVSNSEERLITEYILRNYGKEYLPNHILESNMLINNRLNKTLYFTKTPGEFEVSEYEITKNYNSLSSEIFKNPIRIYPCGPGQNKIFRKQYNDLVTNTITIISNSEKNIKEAFKNIISRHSMLRSVIIHKNNTFHFQEYSINNKFEIDVIDLMNYSYNDQVSILKKAMENLFDYVGNMNKYGTLLYRYLLFKIDNKTYKLLTVFSHLIADAASSNVFTKDFIMEIEQLEINAENKNRNISNVTYHKYLVEMKKYNTKEKYLEYTESNKFKNISKLNGSFEKRRNLVAKTIRIPITQLNLKNQGGSNSKEGILLWLTSILAQIIFQKRYITFRVTNSGRLLYEGNYKNVFGDCHVHYPVVIDTKIDTPSTCTQKIATEFEYYYGEGKLYLEGLSYDNDIIINNKVENLFDNLDFVFNYIGEKSKEESRDYCILAEQDEKIYKTFYTYCHSTKEELIISCRLPKNRIEQILQQFKNIFKSEINYETHI